MIDTVISATTGKEYKPSECIRIVNMKQIAFYYFNDIEILDFYGSKDFKTGEPIMVAIFNKKDSYKAYEKWMKLNEKK